MVVGITGAWFTDKAQGNSNTPIDLGAVRVAYTETAAGAWKDKSTAAVTAPIVPGDRYDFAGKVDFSGSDVDIYALVTLTYKIYESSSKANDLTSALASYIVPNVTFAVAGEKATAISSGVVTLNAGEAMYSMTAAQAAGNSNMPLTGYITIAENTPNKVGEVQLNGGDLYVELSFSIAVVQFRNVQPADALTLMRAAVVYDSTVPVALV